MSALQLAYACVFHQEIMTDDTTDRTRITVRVSMSIECEIVGWRCSVGIDVRTGCHRGRARKRRQGGPRCMACSRRQAVVVVDRKVVINRSISRWQVEFPDFVINSWCNFVKCLYADLPCLHSFLNMSRLDSCNGVAGRRLVLSHSTSGIPRVESGLSAENRAMDGLAYSPTGSRKGLIHQLAEDDDDSHSDHKPDCWTEATIFRGFVKVGGVR